MKHRGSCNLCVLLCEREEEEERGDNPHCGREGSILSALLVLSHEMEPSYRWLDKWRASRKKGQEDWGQVSKGAAKGVICAGRETHGRCFMCLSHWSLIWCREGYFARRQGRKQLYQTKQTLQGSRDTCAGDIPKL